MSDAPVSDDDRSPVLALPLILPAQAQKHVTHNEALRLLDALVQATVASRSQTAPPDTPADGTRHIVPPGAAGAWSGQDQAIALASGNAWTFLSPQPGWCAYVQDEACEARFDGAAWVTPDATVMRHARLGIGTDPDAQNRLAVAAPATLLTHAGAGHRLVLNKAGPAETASLLYQTGWSGRAELGTTGSEDFALKVSPDGSAWHVALQAERATGRLSAPAGLTLGGTLSGAAVVANATDTGAGRLLTTGAGGILGAAPAAPADLDATAGLAAGCWYRISPGAVTTGLPAALASGAGGHLLHQRRATGAETQLLVLDSATSPGDAGLWIRSRDGAPWSAAAWRRVVDLGQLVGTVAQTAGQPTGAVLQEGSGANGHWLRLASGLQICRHSLTASASAATAWSFPQGFAAAPHVSVTVSASLPRCATVSDLTTTGLNLHVFDLAGARAAQTAFLVATGRWF